MSLRVVTWNLNGLDDYYLDERTESAVFTAILGGPIEVIHRGGRLEPSPDILLFQEVVPRSFSAHLRPHLRAGGYNLIPDEQPPRELFEVVAFRSHFKLRSFDVVGLHDSIYARQMTVVDLTSTTGELRIVTAHLDSGPECDETRIVQMRQVADALRNAPGFGVFGGDTNLRAAEWESVRSDLGVIDAWEELGSPADARSTWRRDDRRARFDRVLHNGKLRARTITTLGEGNVEGLQVPSSDHLAVVVTLAHGA